MLEARPARTTAQRSGTEVVLDQLRGIETWTRAHPQTELFLDSGTSREARLDVSRRRDVVARQRQALIEWTDRQLRRDEFLFRSVEARRVLVVHRNDWFRNKFAAELVACGITVVAALDNGADAVGVVVAEQPDVVLVEDKLPMTSGLEMTRAVSRYAPNTVVIAQVANDWEMGPFFDAGAMSVYARRIPPADIAADLRLYFDA